jgi:C4-type Zn-finger protein
MADCPHCGGLVEQPMKEWDMTGNPHGPPLHMKHYVCPACGKRFRKAEKIQPPETGGTS